MQKKIVQFKNFQETFLHSSGQYSGISSSFSVSLNFRVKLTSLHSAKIYRDLKRDPKLLKALNWSLAFRLLSFRQTGSGTFTFDFVSNLTKY